MVILARLLPAEDFGVIAMATVVTGFASLFRDMGTAAAVIQKPELSVPLLDSVFWFNAVIGLAIATIVLLFSPVIALGFAEPRLEMVLCLLSLAFPMASLGAVHQALAERAFRFRPVALVEALGAFLGLACVVWAALHGWGVYSLVLQTLVSVCVATVGFWWISGWRPSRRWCGKEMRGLIGFSGNLVGFNMFNYFARNADNILIGRFLGASELGYYTMAYRLMLWPLQNISNVVGRALFPHFSRMQDDRPRLTHAYLRATAAIVVITAPLMFGLFVLREPFVKVVLGQAWAPVADVLTWLAMVGFMQAIGTTVGSLYLATGRTDVMLKWGMAAGIIATLAFVIGLQWGIEGVAAAYAVVSFILFWPSLAIPFRLIGLRVETLIWRIWPSVWTAGAMATVVGIMGAIWTHSEGGQLLRLIVLVLSGVAVYFLISRFSQREHLQELIKALFAR